MSRHNLKVILAIAGCVGALTACGGGGSDSAEPAADPLAGVPSNATQSPSDFIEYVRSLVSVQADEREPFSVDGVEAPAAEMSEPQPLV